MNLRCPVKDCQREKPGENFLMCKPCWYIVPKELRVELWRKWRDIWKPKTRNWVERARKQLGGDELMKRFRAWDKARRQVIQAAYREEVKDGKF